MFELGPEKMFFIFAFAFIVLGPKELPNVARKLGEGLRQLRSLQDTMRSEIHTVIEPSSPPPLPATPSAEDASDDDSDAPPPSEPRISSAPQSFT